MSQSSVTNDGQANDSQISVISEGRLLDGVALTSHGPATAGHELSRSPGKVGHVLRKYKSIGMLPSRGPGTSSAVATPIRAARPPSLATSKLFSPGYILIAGSGLGHLSSNSSDDDQTVEDEDNTDLESGRSRTSSGSQNSTETIQRGGQETLMETATTDREATHTGYNMNEPEGDEDYEPMTRSTLMRRSGTV